MTPEQWDLDHRRNLRYFFFLARAVAQSLVRRGRPGAMVCIASCDKTVPGCAMALARVNRPAVLLYGGTIMPGLFRGRRVAVGEVFEAVGAVSAGRMDPGDLDELERAACPGAERAAGSTPPTRWPW